MIYLTYEVFWLGQHLSENNYRSTLQNDLVQQLYGSTETSGACTFQSVGTSASGIAGKLIPGITAMVWDDDLKKTLEHLETSELCFKGPMIMKGYYGNADATKMCIDTSGFYHSGDMGYYDEDGNFYIVDRLKELIKYKGFQVPPAELEAFILQHPAVQDCGVIGIPDVRAGQVPLAYLVRQNGTDVTEQNIIDYVAVMARISAKKHLVQLEKFYDENC